jgi:acetyl esterase/lipase
VRLTLKFFACVFLAGGLLGSCIFSRRRGQTASPMPQPAAAPTSTETASGAETASSPDGSAEYLRELTELGYGKYLAESDALRSHSADSGWDVYQYDTSDCRCLLGGRYYLAARKGGEAAKTVFWLEGGGACFPGRDECAKTAERSVARLQSGLASAAPGNPLKDWNYIYVPYCDGAIHLGDADADYDGDGAADRWHWGLKNTSAAVRLLRELFPESREILVAGCSAGGYGTLGATQIVRLQFPEAQLYVLDESGLGIMNPEIRGTYDAAFRVWNFAHLLPPGCPECSRQLIYLFPWMLARDPRLKVGVFSSYHDEYFTRNWEMSPQDYEALLRETTGEIHGRYPDTFKRYLIDGGDHCILDFYQRVDGVSIWEWIRYLVENDPRWSDILE